MTYIAVGDQGGYVSIFDYSDNDVKNELGYNIPIT